MSAAANAEHHARNVRNLKDTNEKLDELARAIAELARALRQIKSSVS
jgi:hypothetical protein